MFDEGVGGQDGFKQVGKKYAPAPAPAQNAWGVGAKVYAYASFLL